MKLKVLIIHDSMKGGGAERVLSTLLNNLDYKRFDVTLLLLYKEGVFLRSLPADVKVVGLCGSSTTLKERIITHFYGIRNYIRLRRAKKVLGDSSFDVTVSFMEGPTAKLHQQLTRVSAKNLSWIHSDIKTCRWYNFWFKKSEECEFYENVDGVAFVSEGAKKSFCDVISSKAELKVIYNPVDVNGIRKQAGAENKAEHKTFTIVNVGRLVPPKNQMRLLEIARILKLRGLDFKVKILGDGQLEQELKAAAKNFGLESTVDFLGYVENPYPVVKEADLFCLTSDHEGFGMVVAESLALGVPVVSTPVLGVSEILSHGGGIIASFDPMLMADIIEDLMMNPDKLHELKSQTEQSVAQFDLDNIIKSVESFFEK